MNESSATGPTVGGAPPPQTPTFLAKAGGILFSIVKHVPIRGVSWGFFGLVLGILSVAGSFALGLLTLGRGAELMVSEIFVAIPIALPFLAGGLISFHGLHRGAARAAIEIEEKLGLVGYLVDRILASITNRFGTTLANLPLSDFEAASRDAVNRYLKSSEMQEGSGIAGWVLRRAKTAILGKIDTYLLAAFRAESTASGGGGVDMAKVGARVRQEVSAQFAGALMSAMNKQLALFSLLVVLLGVGWFHLILGIFALLGKVVPG